MFETIKKKSFIVHSRLFIEAYHIGWRSTLDYKVVVDSFVFL